jgi:thiamine biosynthesis protein ThiC
MTRGVICTSPIPIDADTLIKVPKKLRKRVSAILEKQRELRWNDALQLVLDKSLLARVKGNKQKARHKSGDFTEVDNR